MEKLEKVEGKYYTQNNGDLTIEQRVFFTEGMVKNKDDFRFATDLEVANWKEYLRQQEELMNKDLNNEQL